MPARLLPALALIVACFAIPVAIGQLVSGGSEFQPKTISSGPAVASRTTTVGVPRLKPAPGIPRLAPSRPAP